MGGKRDRFLNFFSLARGDRYSALPIKVNAAQSFGSGRVCIVINIACRSAWALVCPWANWS
jgi:hypothetical protein